MYKILLVDDEVWAVESLRATVEWEKYGFEIVGKAYSGAEALQLIRELNPDLVFTDIRMPGINGLELIKSVSNEGFNVQFIVASGYAEFTYVQKALTFGAMGYILKPYEETDIINCLKKAKELFDKQNLNKKFDNIFEEICNNDKEKFFKILENSGLKWDNNKLFIIATYGENPINFFKYLKLLAFKTGVYKWSYIVEETNRDKIIQYLENNHFPAIQSISVSNCVKNIEELENVIEDTNIAVYSFFTTTNVKIHSLANSDYYFLKEILHGLNNEIKIKDISSINDIFKKLDTVFQSNQYSIIHAYYIYNVVLSFLYSYIDPNEIYIANYHDLISRFNNVFDMLIYLKDLVIKQISVNYTYCSDDIKNENIKLILEYVNSNFQQEITMQSLSQRFFINPNYISQFFKKEVGLNFTEYLAKRRMDYACYLLNNSDLSIQKISEKAGYKDYFYFTRIFKKHMNMTPSEYRHMDLI